MPRHPTVGEVVLVTVDLGVRRPLIVSALQTMGTTDRVSGTLCCEPDDYARPIFRGALDRQADPARIEGRPSRTCPVAYGHLLTPGTAVGQWEYRP